MFRKALTWAAALLALPFFALGAQTRGGLTKVELLALQQQMRDEGCGNQHAAGIWDEATRRAIRNCAKKYNVAADARALLQAMNIGFSPGDNPPTAGGSAISGETSGMKMSGGAMTMMQDSAMMKMHEEMMKTHDMTKMKAMHEKMMKTHDTTMMKAMHEGMMKSNDPAMNKMHESMMKMMHDSTMKMDDASMKKMHEQMMNEMKMKHDSTSHY